MTRSDDNPLNWPEAVGGDAAGVRTWLHDLRLANGDAISMHAPGATVIVGANNAGKSTLLRQLNIVLQSGPAHLDANPPRIVGNVSLAREFATNDLIHWLAAQATLVERAAIHGGDYFASAGAQLSAQAVRAGAHSAGHDHLPDLYQSMVFFADATSRLGYAFNSPGRSELEEPSSTHLHRFQDDRELFRRLSALSERVFGRPLLLDDFAGASIRLRVGTVDLPLPARDEPIGAFGRAVGKLPLLDAQGDGMRSFFGVMIPVLAGAQQIILVDEPEAFLHPPQARALGRELASAAWERGAQLIVATHDKDFISGVLDADGELSIVRLLRTDTATARTQPSPERLRHLRDDRLLRYSNVLNGLFAQLVVLCEGDQDCRFYEAALDHYVSAHGDDASIHTVPAGDVIFIPVNGKGGFANFIPSLQELAVPTVVVPDIDLLRSQEQTSAIFEMLGGEWGSVERDYRVATESRRRPSSRKTVRAVLDATVAVLEPIASSEPDKRYDGAVRETIEEMLSSGSDPWADAKRSGVHAFSGGEYSALSSLLRALDTRGVVLVQVGELERFAPDLAKNRSWLPTAIANGAFASAEAQALIARVMAFHKTSQHT